MSRIRLLATATAYGLAAAACRVEPPPPDGGREAQTRAAPDSARVAERAIAVIAARRPADTLFTYRVAEFRADSAGHLVAVIPALRPEHAASGVAFGGGGGLVRVWRGDSARVLDWYR